MPPGRRPTDFGVSAALLAACAAIVLSLAGNPATVAPANQEMSRAALNAASLMTDDGFYYLKIAENLAGGYGSTFDAVHPTNGYHPLWLLVLVPVHWLVDGRLTALLIAFALQGLLMAGTAWSLYRVARLGMAPGAAVAAVLTWLVIQCGYWPSLSGMEFALQSFLIALLLLEAAGLAGPQPPATGDGVRLAVLLSLAFLARLDNGLLGVAILAALAGAVPRRSVRNAALALGGTILGYGLLNLALFGAILPVSGPLKRDWSLDLLARDPVYQEHGWLAAKLAYLRWPLEHWPGTESALLALGTLGVGAALGADRLGWRPRLFPEPLARPLGPFAWFGLLQVAFYVVVYHGGYSFQPWYFAVQGLLAGLTAGALVETVRRWIRSRRLGRTARRLAAALVASLLITLCVRVVWSVGQKRSAQSGFSRGPLYTTARWVDEHLPPATSVGAWNAGILAYFSRARVINLDGLVNSADYRHRRRDLCRYWREEDVTYLADVFDRRDPFAPFADQAAGCLGDLELLWAGPTYAGSSWGAAVYRIAGEPRVPASPR